MKSSSTAKPLMGVLMAVFFGMALVVALMATMLVLPAEDVHANGGTKSMNVVVQKGYRDGVSVPVTFTTQISGLQALYLTNLDVITNDSGWGIAVCSIEGVGCPADECFSCPASEGGTKFWNYEYWDGSAWQSYPVGASDSVITQDGSVDGWAWGTWGTVPSYAGADKMVNVAVQKSSVLGQMYSSPFNGEISGLDALGLTGLDVITNDFGWGIAVCSIDGVGCPADECFSCAASEGGTRFWNYEYWDSEVWQSYQVGASSSVISQSGAIEGWAWGAWGATPKFAGHNKLGNVVLYKGIGQSNATSFAPVTYTGEISGIGFLLRSGLNVVIQDYSWGQAVCSIEGVGCPADECFSCEASEGGTKFWNYNYWNGDNWTGYSVGASAAVISQAGATDGWAWGTWGTFPPTRGANYGMLAPLILKSE